MNFVCAWCDDFKPNAPNAAHTTHGMCPTCKAKLNAQIDALEAQRKAA